MNLVWMAMAVMLSLTVAVGIHCIIIRVETPLGFVHFYLSISLISHCQIYVALLFFFQYYVSMW